MFDAVRNNKRVAQVVLALISITFAFWGVESYLNDRATAGEVASVGGTKITMGEFQRALREQQDRMRAQSDQPIDSSTFQSPLFKRAVLDNTINQRVLALYAAESGLAVPDELLRQTIAGIPAFQEDGQFSMERYERAVRSQGMTVQGFQERLRADLANQQVIDAVSGGVIVPTSVASRFLETQLEERTVHMVQFNAEDYEQKVSVDEAELKAYYDENISEFSVPARLKAAYVVLTPEAIKAQISISDEELQAAYDARKAALEVPEERKASHILIEVPAGASDEQVAAAKARAQGLLDKLKADPASFAALAKAESDDPGSKSDGGNLGFFGRGAMLPEFEDAVFSAKAPGLIPEIVKTEFGFHVIQLDEIRAASTPGFADSKDRIRDELVEEAAGRRFAEVAEQFANMVYEQPDSLAPVAESFGLEIKTTSEWIVADDTKVGDFESAALVKALFSDDVFNDKHNTDAIDLGDNRLIAARVAEEEPAHQRSFDEAKTEIEKLVRTRKAAALAVQEGEEKLAKLQAGDAVELDWGADFTIQRGVPSLPPILMQPIFAADAQKLPAYTGVAMSGAGYALFRVDAVKAAEVTKDDERIKAIQEQYGQMLGNQDLRAFLNALRSKYDVKINAAALAEGES
ncbi:SurA N-terminal domain-containing protein [Nitrogeniibacter aestuarii]|uniref:SurA N-terminal domain-containing protein n=1 Tax=Nitrogeniibacter aestuarii TaxID=2815343 RepID=UPI001D0F7A79|nr:SurA N-terminal domain-containing protein [Nitrogeniibacter aestuarii]